MVYRQKRWKEKAGAALLAAAFVFSGITGVLPIGARASTGMGLTGTVPQSNGVTESQVEADRQEIALNPDEIEEGTVYVNKYGQTVVRGWTSDILLTGDYITLSAPADAPTVDAEVRASLRTRSGGYKYDENNPFVEQVIKVPPYAYIPCTTGAYTVKIDLTTEKVVARYLATPGNTGGPRRIGYDQWGNAWVALLNNTVGNTYNITCILADVDDPSFTPGVNTSNSDGPALAYGTEKAVRSYGVSDGIKNATGGAIAEPRGIVFDAEGHLWLGPSSGNYLREYKLHKTGTGANTQFTFELLRTVVIGDGFNGTYVVTMTPEGNIFIAGHTPRGGWTIDLADHDMLYPPYANMADREKADTRIKSRKIDGIGNTYSASADVYSGDVWYTTRSGVIHRVLPDGTLKSYTIPGITDTTGIEIDKQYVYVCTYNNQKVVRLDKTKLQDDTTGAAFVASTQVYAVSGNPHGIFPHGNKAFIVCPGDNTVKVLDFATGTAQVINNATGQNAVGGQPYVYGAFVTTKLPPGARITGRNYVSATGDYSAGSGIWSTPQTNRDGYVYEVHRKGKAPWMDPSVPMDELLFNAKARTDGTLVFWGPDEQETAATTSVHLEQGNYFIVQKQSSKADEELSLFAGVKQGNYLNELKWDASDKEVLYFSIYKDMPIELDLGYVTGNIKIDKYEMSTWTNKDVVVTATISSPVNAPTDVVLVSSALNIPADTVKAIPHKETTGICGKIGV